MAEETQTEDTSVQVTDRDGVTHTLRDPSRSLVYYPTSQRFTLERGMTIEEESKLGGVLIQEDLVEDVDAAIVSAVALTLAQTAQQHDIQVIRVSQAGNGADVAAALREAGFYVVEFSG